MPLKILAIKTKKPLPHDNVYARLGVSPTHGVGVFAIRDIPKNTNIFSNDKVKMVWVKKDELESLPAEVRKLYEDFCVTKGNKLGCPENFNSLTIGWYMNDSAEHPNVRCTEHYDFVAARDIKKGEELLADYSSYSEILD